MVYTSGPYRAAKFVASLKRGQIDQNPSFSKLTETEIK